MRYEDYFCYSGKGSNGKNEDLIGTHSRGVMRLDFICDGMSSYGFGAWASEIVMQELLKAFIMDPEDESTLPSIIRGTVDVADKRIWKERLLAKSKFGVTLGGVISGGNRMHAFWIGDVKIFQVREHTIIFESQEHSLVRAIELTKGEEQAYSNAVTASLSGRGIEKLAIIELEMNAGDVILICSDGIWKAGGFDWILDSDHGTLQNILSGIQFEDDHSLVRFRVC